MYTKVEPSWSDEKLRLVYWIIDQEDKGEVDFTAFTRIADVFHMNIIATHRDNLYHPIMHRFPRIFNSQQMKQLRKLVHSNAFSYSMDAVVILSSIMVTVSFWFATESGEVGPNGAETLQETDSYAPVAYLFFAIFFVEMILKMFALGSYGYFSSHWNKFDFFVVFVGFIDLTFGFLLRGTQFGVNILRVFLLLRVFRLYRIFGKIPPPPDLPTWFMNAPKAKLIIFNL